MSRIIFIFGLLWVTSGAKAQKIDPVNLDSIRDLEYQLEGLSHRIINGEDENERMTSCFYFIQTLKEALKIPGSFYYEFPLIKTVSILKPDDERFRIFTWNLLLDSGKYIYYGAIQLSHKEDLLLYGLYDSSEVLEDPEFVSVDHRNWVGALYYQVHHYRYKKEDYYLLMGWDGQDGSCNKKVLDILWFDETLSPRFGLPVFQIDDVVQHRVIFTFADEASMLMRYEKEEDMVVFANLVPPNPLMKDNYNTYLPDGTYDYFKRKGPMWIRYEMLWGNSKNSHRYRKE